MDANKQQKLVDVGFKVLPVCDLCEHFQVAPYADFGVCLKHQYEHLKHTGPPRDLSVPRTGSCPDWEASPYVQVRLQRYVEFVQAPAQKKVP